MQPNEVNLETLTITLSVAPITDLATLQQANQKVYEAFIRVSLQRRAVLAAKQLLRIQGETDEQPKAENETDDPALVDTQTDEQAQGQKPTFNKRNFKALNLAGALETLLQTDRDLGQVLEKIKGKYQTKKELYGKTDQQGLGKAFEYLARQLKNLDQPFGGENTFSQGRTDARNNVGRLGGVARKWLDDQTASAIQTDRAFWEREFVGNIIRELAAASKLAQE